MIETLMESPRHRLAMCDGVYSREPSDRARWNTKVSLATDL
jgi:hypothetical protein